MNKHFFIWGILIATAQKAFCETDAVTSQLGLKTHTGEPTFMSIVFALLFVIFLIYVTGLIYSKLNVIGAKTVRNQLESYDLKRAIVLSTTQLGQNKNLHVIELNKKHYLIGATQNSINLITELKLSNEQTQNEIEKQADADIDDAIRVLYNGKREEETKEEKIEQSEDQEEFDVHKKYL